MTKQMQRTLGMSAITLTVLVGTRAMLSSQANVVMADAATPVEQLINNPLVQILMVLGLIMIGLVAINVWIVIRSEPRL